MRLLSDQRPGTGRALWPSERIPETPLTATTLEDVKRLLHAFAGARTGLPRQAVEAEYGELLIYLVRLADQLGIDLIAAAQHCASPDPQKLREPR